MSKFLCTKAVPLKNSKNLTVSIVSSNGVPFLRFALNTTEDHGVTATGKSHTISTANGLMGDTCNIRVNFSGYRGLKTKSEELSAAMAQELKSEKESEVKTIGGLLSSTRGRGFIARGNPFDNLCFIDIAGDTIATLANPQSTDKERDAVAPHSSSGTTRLIASSMGFTSIAGKISLNFNIMINADNVVNTQGLADALGIKADDPLFVSLCNGHNAGGKAGNATSAANATTGNSNNTSSTVTVQALNNAVRTFLENLTEEQIAKAVTFVLEAKIKSSGSNAADAWATLSQLQSTTVRNWFISHLVGVAVEQFRLELVMDGKDISSIASFVPKSNAEVMDLYSSASNGSEIAKAFKSALIAQLEKLSENAIKTGDDSEEPSKKKARPESQ